MNTSCSPDLLFKSPWWGWLLGTLLLISLPAAVAGQRSYSSWPAYGGGPEQIRDSSLAQIDRSNVARLEARSEHGAKRPVIPYICASPLVDPRPMSAPSSARDWIPSLP